MFARMDLTFSLEKAIDIWAVGCVLAEMLTGKALCCFVPPLPRMAAANASAMVVVLVGYRPV